MLPADHAAASAINHHRARLRAFHRLTGLLLIGLLTAASAYASLWPSAAGAQADRVDFRRDIEPILAQHCYSCHSAAKAAAQLRLDVRALAFKGGLGGQSILPGNSRDSRLVHRIRGLGGEKQMPLGGDPLTPDQIALVARWIDEGAEWPDAGPVLRTQNPELPRHWAYLKPVSPALPDVKNDAWVRNPIDRFILARLEKEGLSPAPEATKEMLLRRVYLDLTGLPPGISEIDEFLADNSPDAYEKVVDRLLASPHYGERQARPWLDLARYADSNGYEKDSLRVMWKYRDWVINALNRDLPFDQFTIEQIAGDMLPGATIEQQIATGFHRNTLLNQEGGVDPEEARYEVLVDRVNTTATVWLGATLGCAQCHNHKYDPFTQKDYFRMYAFFENAKYEIRGPEHFSRVAYEPTLDLPTPEQESRRRAINEEISALEEVLKTQTPQLDAAQAEWERTILTAPDQWTVIDPAAATSTGGATLTKQADKSLLASGIAPEFDEYIIRATAGPGRITALRLEAMPDVSLPRGGPGRDLYGNFILSTIEASFNGRRLKFTDGGWDDGLSKLDRKSFFNYETGQISDRPRGWLINAMNDQTRMLRQAVFVLDEPLALDKPVELEVRLKFLAGGLCQSIGRVRLSATGSADPLQIVQAAAALKLVMAKPAAERSQSERERLSASFRSLTPLLKKQRDRLRDLQESLRDLGIVTALVMQERPSFERPSTLFRERGSFMSPGERVYAATPAVLPPLPDSAPVNRLGLAQWLVDENNPLTARVTVNRTWQQFFGRGIVETAEDFGTQSSPPSHPELLDWLAVAFRDGTMNDERGMMNQQNAAERNIHHSSFRVQRWSMKALHRLIVTSATYRQSSAVSPALLERDPYNRLLARGPRFRMEAEMIRDTSLTASGLLSRSIGGPSVMPPQPEGIWNNPYSNAEWTTAKGEDRYRRGLYTFIRRTSPYPAMMNFDATSREVCTVRRVRTNTPLQSLTLLNDEAAMEMARALAKRMLVEAVGSVPARAEYGFRLCLTRRPQPAELDRLVKLYEQQLAHYRADTKAAGELLRGEARELPAPELAAWTIVANVLLNLDETVTKQ